MVKITRNYPNLKIEDLKNAVRRILPIEYFVGAYSEERPVRKSFTDALSKSIKDEIALRVA